MMKTKSEIEAEAQQLTILGRQYQNEQSPALPGAPIIAGPRVLVRLPVPLVSVRPVLFGNREAFVEARRERRVEAAFEEGELVYRLVEREVGNSLYPGEETSLVVISSQSAYDVLHTGYELDEEERLASQLEHYSDRGSERDESADDERVAEIEAILEAKLLPAADRLRTRAEIFEFLAGRMEPSEFITIAIDRQCEREGHAPRQAQRHEIKLTIDEP